MFVRSEYTFLSSSIKLEDLYNYIKKSNIKNVTIADKNNVYAHTPLQIMMDKDPNFKVNLGLEVDILNENHLLIAKNDKGLASIKKLSSLINNEQEFELTDFLNDDNLYVLTFKSKITKKKDPKKIIDHLYKEDKKWLEIMLKIKNQKDVIITNLDLENNHDFIEINTYYKPLDYSFKIPKLNKDSFLEIKKISIVGMNKRYQNQTSEQLSIIKKRLSQELNVIKNLGFADYFLIVFEIIKFCNQNKIVYGPGRGSAPGSLVSYVLGITNIDPIANDLIFERFLNKDRKSMPDIDIDIQDDRRQEVVDFLLNKFGHSRTAQIITFTRYKINMALRDLCRFEFTDAKKDVDAFLNALKFNKKEVASNILKLNSDLNNAFIMAKKMINMPKTTSIHAAGILISPNDISQSIGTKKENNFYVTQTEHKYLEKLGYLKIDLLALRNLTMLSKIKNSLEKNTKKIINLKDIPLNSKKTFYLFNKGWTNGIFQFENQGLRKFLKDLKPQKIDDLANITALYRPGPIDYINDYIKNKNNKHSIKYQSEEFKKVLSPTSNIMIFQEQVMQILQLFANYDYAKTDLIRRAISKKDLNLMNNLKDSFIKDSIKNGYQEQLVKNTWNDITKFANYGFNKSHAYGYSMISYQMAYFKANYPEYFYDAYLQSFVNFKEKLNPIFIEARYHKIKIIKPSVKYSKQNFYVKDNQIISPLIIIEGIGHNIANQIIQNNDKYNDIYDFLVSNKNILNKKILKNLILSGALDCFNLTRKHMINELNYFLEYDEFFLKNDKKADESEYKNKELIEFETQIMGVNFTKISTNINLFYLKKLYNDKYNNKKAVLVNNYGEINAYIPNFINNLKSNEFYIFKGDYHFEVLKPYFKITKLEK